MLYNKLKFNRVTSLILHSPITSEKRTLHSLKKQRTKKTLQKPKNRTKAELTSHLDCTVISCTPRGLSSQCS